MSNPDREIVTGSEVTLHFRMTLPDGTEALSTFGEEPLHFAIGDGTFKGGFELSLYGLKAGDTQTLTLDPEQAFGYHDPALIHDMPRSDFPADMVLEEGQVMAFSTPTGDEAAGIILEAGEDSVKVDFNHPMAGQDVIFHVEILEVGLPTELPAANDDDDSCGSC
jgi:FKBP-type peptidyl-prolyl cis-trans isomerase SlpA